MNNDEIKVKLSYGVDYYKGDKGDKPIKGVDYFTEQDINEIIERIEAGEIDLTSYATKEYVADAIEDMIVEETDPTVPEWAKAETKPSYTANEVGALPADTALFSGDYEDLSNKPELFSGDYDDLSNKPNLFSGNYNDLTNKPTIPTVPVNVSAFYNDAGYLTSHQDLTGYATESYVDDAIANIELPDGGITVETDPTVPSWAKQANKPTYTAQEVGALPANTALFSGDYNDLSNKPTIPTIPTNISAFTNDAGYITSASIEYTSQDLPGMGNPYGLLMNNWEDVVAITTSISDFGCMSMAIDEDDNPTHMSVLYGGMSLLQNNVSGNGICLAPDGIIASNMADYEQNENYVSITFGANYDGLYVNGSKVALVSDIPTAYTLPTATTSTLGGVKVDGTTITISNGVISATSSGGGSYTAGDGIVIDNGEISVDFGNEIENGGFSFAQHYENENYYEYTSNIYPYEINITSYGEADPETGDQEPKSISITGEGITFDDTGDTHTLGVSNGELVFDDSPIGSGGGSNTRIIVVSDVGNINTSITADDKAYLLNALDNGYDAYPFVFSENKSGNIHTYIPVKYNVNGKQITVFNIDDRHLITLSYFASNNNFGYSHLYLYGTFFRAGLSATDAPSGNAYSTIAQEFTYIKNNYATKAEIVIPSAPSTNGNYVLQATVADGAVVYDWVEVSVGGSY